ncbi:MAG: protein translocase subunit SecD [Armatimonadetes bacterium]|nr:protein translocase subunit SecD [Armatimonadota bacterium]MDE2205969.1 protein translocase subunit SecD [Armatimonadota bacterium]
MPKTQHRALLVFILALAVASIWVSFSKKIRVWYGLDIQGGVRAVLAPEIDVFNKEHLKDGKTWSADNLEAVRRILENRVNFQGVSEPVITTRPQDNQIVVELPGLKNEQQALQELQSTANLQFYLLPELGNKNNTRPATWSVRDQADSTGQKTETLIDNTTGQPVTPAQLDAMVFSRDPIVTGSDLLPNCRAEINAASASPDITFQFNSKGSGIFEQTTRAHIGDYLAIFLDKKLLTAPTIDSVIPGQGIIQGNFTLESAKALADQLNAGALPVPLQLLEVRKVEATLGREAVKATEMAGLIGLGLVLLVMLLYYRVPGLLADAALILYTFFSFALFKLWPVTLTLPGIAGFILSIGMAVDANILIFERTKEELRAGKTLNKAIDEGFRRAFTAIFDSNTCTVITCLVLYYFGTGPIRGFALTLGLGVALSMFTAITVTRTFLFTLVSLGIGQSERAYGLNVHWDPGWRVMSRKWLWLGFSGLVIIPGLAFWGMGGIKRSIDFQGGTELDVPFASRHSPTQIEQTLAKLSPRYKDCRVVVSDQGVGSAAGSILAYVTIEKVSDAQRQAIIDTLTQQVGPLVAGQSVQYATVSGVISRQLTIDAIKAVIVASLLIVLFLAFRFSIGGFLEGLKYGTCAIIALLHDVLVVWGSFAILGYFLNWQIDSLFVTAMLTVIGFSVHDTIIVFDRIRENLHNRQKGETFGELADRSINQTIARSVNTSFTVILTLTALFLFGGNTIHQFVAALIIGIISGTYSSIFNASVLLVMWKQRDVATAAAAASAISRTVGGRSGRSTVGDRALVSPQRPVDPRVAPAADDANGEPRSDPGAGSRLGSRKQPVRRRRM